jgi:hypothetical protein
VLFGFFLSKNKLAMRKIDKSSIDKYREKYEAGEIALRVISIETKISQTSVVSYTEKSGWNKKLAHKNQVLRKKKILIEKIETFKADYESGKIFQYQILKKVKCDEFFLRLYIKNNWDKTANIKNLLEITMRLKNSYLKRRKLNDKCKNFESGKIFYTSEGLPLIFKGMKNGKPLAKHTLYTKHTYTNQEIKNFENENQESQM